MFFFLDGSKIELEFKSDVNTKTNSLPNGDVIQKYGNEILDMRVAQTDMKVRHIFRKFVEVFFPIWSFFQRSEQENKNKQKQNMPLLSLGSKQLYGKVRC